MGVSVTYKGNTIASFNNGSGKILNTAGKFMEDNVTIVSALSLQSKTVNPTASAQTITADNGYDGLSSVSVAAVKEHVATITGTGHSARVNVEYDSVIYYHNGDSFTFNNGETAILDCIGSRGGGQIRINGILVAGGQDDVNNYSYTLPDCNITIALVYGSGSTIDITEDATSITLQSKTISPTESQQTVSADSGYDGLSTVTVNAISNTYVGSGITRRSSSDLSASGATVTVPAGYYASQATKSVSTTTHPNPTASINSSTGLVTASHTQTAGYVSAGTTTGTLQLTTQAAKTVTPTTSSQTAVAAGRYTTGVITVAAIPSNYVDSSTLKTYYTGSSAPSSSLGANGDLYFQSTGA